MDAEVTIDDVRRAAAGLAGAVARTPCTPSSTLSAVTGAEVWCKWEQLQHTASFKERGARWFLAGLDAATLRRGVIAASAGNHAQGVAHHAALLGAPATVVMPATTPFTKVTGTEHLGAEVVLHGVDFSAALAHARLLATERDLTFVPAFDDLRVIAGQGTVALEILEQAPGLDVLVVPVGGGGLVAGCAVVMKALAPHVRVVGVQTESHPAFARALGRDTRTSVVTAVAPTIADGIAVQEPGRITTSIARALVDDVVVVAESAIEDAVGRYLEIEKAVVEGAGAASLAALLDDPSRFAGMRCGLVVSGGNIDSRVLASVVLRTLARTGRLVRFRIDVPDVPGRLAAIAAAIGDRGGNIVDVEHHRDRPGTTVREAVLEVSVETRDAAHAGAIEEALRALGLAVARV